MVTNSTLNFHPTYHAPRKRVALLTLLTLGLGFLAALIVLNASANAPTAAELRIQSWVSELQQERLTAQRHSAQRELENAGQDAVPALVAALRSNNPVLRRNAADMLGFIASPLPIASLQFTLANDPVPAVRRNAAWALGEINSLTPYNELRRAALFDSNALVRATAQDSLARMRTRLALATKIDERALNAYAVAPSSSEVIYAATRRDLILTHDGGKTWATLKNTLPSMTNVLAVSPTDTLTLYAGVDGLGMFKSADGGHTWNRINNGLEISAGTRHVITAIAIDPMDSQRVAIAAGVMLGTGNVEFVATGIYQSNDGGVTWNLTHDNRISEPVTQLAFKGNQIYALIENKVRVYSAVI